MARVDTHRSPKHQKGRSVKLCGSGDKNYSDMCVHNVVTPHDDAIEEQLRHERKIPTVHAICSGFHAFGVSFHLSLIISIAIKSILRWAGMRPEYPSWFQDW